MAITTGQFERALYPALRVVIKDAEEELMPEYTVMFNVLDTSRAYEEEWTWAGLGLPAAKPEGQPTAQSMPVTGYYTRYNQATYGLLYRVTLEMRQFEKYGVIRELGHDLGSSIHEGIELLTSGILNLGTTTNLADGVPLFSLVHPIYRGGTQSNRLSTLSDLTYTSYQQLLTMFETVLSNEGRKRRLTPSVLWHAPAMEWKAREILESTDRPDTANRAVSTIHNRRVTRFMWHYGTSSTVWGMKGLKTFDRVFFGMRPTTSKGFEFDTEDFKVKELFMVSYGVTDYRGWFLGNS